MIKDFKRNYVKWSVLGFLIIALIASVVFTNTDNQENEAQAVFKEYKSKLYNVSYNSINMENAIKDNDEYKQFFTQTGFDQFSINRVMLLPRQVAYNKKYDLQLKDLKFKKASNVDKNKLVFDYDLVMNLLSTDGSNSDQNEVGQVILVQENGQWKIENDWFNLNDVFKAALKIEVPMNSKSPEQTNNEIVFPGDALTYLSSTEIVGQNLFITQTLKEIYRDYSNSKNDELLKGLSPIDVLRLFNQACEDNNIEMQVSLIELPTDVIRNQFIQEIQKDQVSKEVEKQILQRLHELKGKIIERIVNDKKAYIIIEKNGWYRMEKNKDGIWKVGWMTRA